MNKIENMFMHFYDFISLEPNVLLEKSKLSQAPLKFQSRLYTLYWQLLCTLNAEFDGSRGKAPIK